MTQWFEQLTAAGALSSIDAAFARCIASLTAREARQPGLETDPLLLLGAAVASRSVRQGHVCAPLDEVVAAPPVSEDGVAVDGFVWPSLDAWLDALASSPAVCVPPDDHGSRPLVLSGGRLYMQRYYRYERGLALQLARRAESVEDVDEALLDDDIACLFPRADTVEAQQAEAARNAARRRLSVVSGGPGTGKTRTVARILAIIAHQALAHGRPAPRVELLAPTGKAAQRLGEAFVANLDAGMDVPPDVLAALPRQAATIHRRLGTLHDQPTRFRHNEENPLFADVVVVDEASMVDLSLLARLVDAVPRRSRLVLLGDRDQLASVEAGAVYGDICAAAELAGGALSACVVQLDTSFRTDAGGPIAALARSIRAGDGPGVLRALETGSDALSWVTGVGVSASLDRLADEIVAGYTPLVTATTPAGALARVQDYRVLCAHRRGEGGAAWAGARIERLLTERGVLRRQPQDLWYPGRPVMVLKNDYQLDLFNGDVGVALEEIGPDGERRLRVWFPSATGDGEPRAIAPSRVPAHETCFAMTVHKSQGSEFNGVAVVLPSRPSPICTRELLYTAVTRARRRVTIVGSHAVVEATVARRVVRASGLIDGLRADAHVPLPAGNGPTASISRRAPSGR